MICGYKSDRNRCLHNEHACLLDDDDVGYKMSNTKDGIEEGRRRYFRGALAALQDEIL